jgi:hypothetical protein
MLPEIPLRVGLRKIAELRAKEGEAAAAREANQITLGDALDRWLRSRKEMSIGTTAAYKVVVARSRTGLRSRASNTSRRSPLICWISGGVSGHRTRSGRTARLVRYPVSLLDLYEGLLLLSTKIGLISSDPSLALDSISIDSKETLPLNHVQFDELLAATKNTMCSRPKSSNNMVMISRSFSGYAMDRTSPHRRLDASPI